MSMETKKNQELKKNIKSTPKNQIVQGTQHELQKAIGNIKTGSGDARLDTAVGAIKSMLGFYDKVANTFQDGIKGTGMSVKEGLDAAKKGVAGGIDTAKLATKQTVGDVKNLAKGAANTFQAGITGTGMSVKEGLDAAKKGGADALRNLAQNLDQSNSQPAPQSVSRLNRLKAVPTTPGSTTTNMPKLRTVPNGPSVIPAINNTAGSGIAKIANMPKPTKTMPSTKNGGGMSEILQGMIGVYGDIIDNFIKLNQKQLQTIYKIKPGDNLTLIAQKTGNTVEGIRKANPDKIKDVNWIYAGDTINIPNNSKTQPKATSKAL